MKNSADSLFMGSICFYLLYNIRIHLVKLFSFTRHLFLEAGNLFWLHNKMFKIRGLPNFLLFILINEFSFSPLFCEVESVVALAALRFDSGGGEGYLMMLDKRADYEEGIRLNKLIKNTEIVNITLK